MIYFVDKCKQNQKERKARFRKTLPPRATNRKELSQNQIDELLGEIDHDINENDNQQKYKPIHIPPHIINNNNNNNKEKQKEESALIAITDAVSLFCLFFLLFNNNKEKNKNQ